MQKQIHRTIQIGIKYPYSRNSNGTVLKLKKLKLLYGRLWKISLQINERFNWTICAVLCVYFCTITAGTYWVFMRIKFNRFNTMWRKKIHHKNPLNTLTQLSSILEVILLHFSLPMVFVIFITELENWTNATKQIAKSIFVHKNFSDDLARKVL